MTYTSIISLPIDKRFYLLISQSISFQIVSESVDIFVKFSNFMSQGWGFLTPYSARRGEFLYTLIVPGFFLPSSRVPGVYSGGGGGEGMVLDETDTCIRNKICFFEPVEGRDLLLCCVRLLLLCFLFAMCFRLA